MSDRAMKRGRLYSCLHCEKKGTTYHEAKYRVEGHVLKHHLSLDDTRYYCTLCLFRCTTEEKLNSHVTKYKRHVDHSSGVQDHSVFLKHNPGARVIQEGVDFRVLSTLEQACTMVGVNQTQQDDTWLDGEMTDTVSGSQSVMERPDSQNLVSVQLTPGQLAILLSHQPAEPARVRQPPAMSCPPTVTRKLGTVTCTQSAASLEVYPKTTTQSSASPLTPLLDESPWGGPTLNTPKRREVEDLLPQLLGNMPTTPLAFSPLLPIPIRSSDKACQTEPEPVQQQALELNTDKLTKVIQSSFSSISRAIETNAQAIRTQDRTMSKVVDVLDQMSQTLRRIGAKLDNKSQESRDHHPRDDDSENNPPSKRHRSGDRSLKSVVHKK